MKWCYFSIPGVLVPDIILVLFPWKQHTLFLLLDLQFKPCCLLLKCQETPTLLLKTKIRYAKIKSKRKSEDLWFIFWQGRGIRIAMTRKWEITVSTILAACYIQFVKSLRFGWNHYLLMLVRYVFCFLQVSLDGQKLAVLTSIFWKVKLFLSLCQVA